MATKQATTYSNLAVFRVVESALNTLTFAKLEIANVFTMGSDKLAMIVNRIVYYLGGSDMALFNSTQDQLDFGISTTNNLSGLDLSTSALVDFNTIIRMDLGVAASGMFLREPYEKDFTSLPGGGLLVPADRLYCYAKGTGLTGPTTVQARLYYTPVTLSPEEYWQLVEQRTLLTT